MFWLPQASEGNFCTFGRPEPGLWLKYFFVYQESRRLPIPKRRFSGSPVVMLLQACIRISLSRLFAEGEGKGLQKFCHVETYHRVLLHQCDWNGCFAFHVQKVSYTIAVARSSVLRHAILWFLIYRVSSNLRQFFSQHFVFHCKWIDCTGPSRQLWLWAIAYGLFSSCFRIDCPKVWRSLK